MIAGEASGDLHGSNLVKALKGIHPEVHFRGLGGDHMLQEGVSLVQHYRETSFMGFVEVVAHLRKIRKLMKKVRDDLLSFRPDVLILIDYPGFNLPMARFAGKHGIKVVYYISPKVWAWKTSRVKTIKRFVDQMFVILPFEKEFYRDFGFEVIYEGNPLTDSISGFLSQKPSREEFLQAHGLPDKPLIGLIPGSRVQEVSRTLPVMLQMVDRFPDCHFVVTGMGSLEKSLYTLLIGKKPVSLLFDQTYPVMHFAHAAVVTSGTATLEAALLKTPQVVCYKAQALSYIIARRLVRVSHISLVNLIMGRTVVTELLQKDMNAESLGRELNKILFDPEVRRTLADDYISLEKVLGEPGVSLRIARQLSSKIFPDTDVK